MQREIPADVAGQVLQAFLLSAETRAVILAHRLDARQQPGLFVFQSLESDAPLERQAHFGRIEQL